jgi:hypothetical protein
MLYTVVGVGIVVVDMMMISREELLTSLLLVKLESGNGNGEVATLRNRGKIA